MLRELRAEIERQRAAEAQRSETLAQTIGRLEKLTARQQVLAQRSRRVLRRPSAPSGERANLPQEFLTREKHAPIAASLSADQRTVRQAAASVLASLSRQQQTLRQLLRRAYGGTSSLAATEVDPIVDLLVETVAAQDRALANLAPEAVRWPQANTALHTAAGRMKQALDALRRLQPPETGDNDQEIASRNVGNSDENMEGLQSEPQNDRSQSVAPGDFQEALSLRSLPIPDYTSVEILAEEAANQQRRARQNAARAGARVEKNW